MLTVLPPWEHNSSDAGDRDLDVATILAEASAGRNPVASNRVVFNIKGNDYRLVVALRYDKQIMFIRFVGTHAEYDRIDASAI